MLKDFTRNKLFITLLFSVSFLILLAIGIASYRVTQLWITNRQQVATFRNSLFLYERVLSLLKDAETGQRGYILTGDSTYLEPYKKTIDTISVYKQSVASVHYDNVNQKRSLHINNLIGLKLTELQTTIKIKEQQGLGAGIAAVQSNTGKWLMDSLRTEIRTMQNIVNGQIRKGDQIVANKSRQLTFLQIAGSVCSSMLLLWAFWLLRQQMQHRQKALTALEELNNSLEHTVAERTNELHAALEELNSSNEELHASNEELFTNNEQQNILLHKLGQTQQELQMALEAARMGTWEWNIQTGEIIWSQTLEPLFKMAPGEFKRKYGGNFEGFRQLVHPEDRSVLTQAITKAIEDKCTYQMDFRFVKPDGKVGWMNGQGKAIYDLSGIPQRMISIGIEITERKEAENSLQASERLKKEIFEGSADALFLIRAETSTIEDVNQQAISLFGYANKEEVIGRQGEALQKYAYTDEQIASILKEIQEKRYWSDELEYISKTGREFWGNAAVSLISVEEQSYFLIRIRDITDRKLAEEAILQSRHEILIQKKRAEEALAIIEKDNLRKTRELEEARLLQISMLPQEPPAVDNIDMAMYMKTSEEVGGDYYDYKLEEDGTITIIVGDATGHGLKAGIVVATVKSYFQTLASQCTVSELLHRISEGIQNLQIRGMYMGVTVMKIKNDHVSIASSGMPPLFLYKHATQQIEQIMLKGLFLGSTLEFTYQYTSVIFENGDTLLVMSDGLPELFNENRKMLDYDRIQACYEEVAHLPAKEIIDKLVQLGDRWAPQKDNEDDITLVAIKAKL